MYRAKPRICSLFRPLQKVNRMYDVIIVGGGAAALSAAIYTFEKRLRVLVIYDVPGGKTGSSLIGHPEDHHSAARKFEQLGIGREWISSEVLPVGEHIMQCFQQELQVHQESVVCDRVTHITRMGDLFQVETHHHGMYQSITLIIATGVTPRLLDVPGAQHFLDHGLSYSATTHAARLVGQTVAMVGTTMRTLRACTELAHIASHVYLIGTSLSRLSETLVTLLDQRPNVEILEGWQVVELRGGTSIEQILIRRSSDEYRLLTVDAVFIDLGLKPNSEMVQHMVQTDRSGFIWVNEQNATTQRGVFAAGDVTTAFSEQMLIAIGDGARAALSAYDYLLAYAFAQTRVMTA